MDIDTDVLADPSPASDVPADSSPAPDVPSSSDDGKSVPYDRFKEVNDGFKQTKEELESVRNELQEFKSKFQDKPQEEEETIPDPYDDAKGFLDLATQRAIEAIKSERQKEEMYKQKADEIIENQFKEIEKTGKVDREAVVGFAQKYGIRDDDGTFNLIKANELYSIANPATDDTARARLTPSGGSSVTKAHIDVATDPNLTIDDIISAAV